MVRAVSWTATHCAIFTEPTLIAVARAIETVAVLRTVAGTAQYVAAFAVEPRLAKARPVVALAAAGAGCTVTHTQRTCLARPPFITVAGLAGAAIAVPAAWFYEALARWAHLDTAVVTVPPRPTLAAAILAAHTMV